MEKTLSSVKQLIEKARKAQQVYETYDQQCVDEVVTAVAWALTEPGRNLELSRMAVEKTGLGRVESLHAIHNILDTVRNWRGKHWPPFPVRPRIKPNPSLRV